MTAYNYTLTGGDVNTRPRATYEQQHHFIDIDFATIFAGTVASAIGDTFDLIAIPAGFLVERVYAVIQVASTTATANILVGDTTDTDGYLTAADLDAAAGTFVSNTGALIDTEIFVYYATANKLRIGMDTAKPTNGKVRVGFIGWQLV